MAVSPLLTGAALTKAGTCEGRCARRRAVSVWSPELDTVLDIGLDTEIKGVLRLKAPRGVAAPLVFDSPHSGAAAPVDFDTAAPRDALRNSRDSFVDDLFGDAPDYGAHLLTALFPRAYIDPNRALCDMDARLLDEPWPGPLTPGDKTRFGHGLIWRRCPPNHDMYDRKLSVVEVQGRIERYWFYY